MSQRILFVDDEPNILNKYKRVLHRAYKFDTAVGGGVQQPIRVAVL